MQLKNKWYGLESSAIRDAGERNDPTWTKQLATNKNLFLSNTVVETVFL